MSIQSFRDRLTEELFHGETTKRTITYRAPAKVIRRKLDMLDYAERLTDLASPPGNRLESLKGSLSGHYSIHINDRYRIVFQWSKNGPEKVGVTDYHS